MKFLMLIGLSLVSLAFNSAEGENKIFEGSITYVLDTERSDPEAIGNLAEQITISISGDISRWEEQTVQGSRAILTDIANRRQYVLMQFLGKKIALVTPPDDVLICEIPEVVETKCCVEIAGIKCQVMNTRDGEVAFDPTVSLLHPMLPETDGTPLSFPIKSQFGTGYYVASEITPGRPDQELFVVPEDYEIVAPNELKTLFTQMGSTNE